MDFMKQLFAKLISALLVAALLLTPAAMMEAEIGSEAVDDIVTEQSSADLTEDSDGAASELQYEALYDAEGGEPEGGIRINVTNFPDMGLRTALSNQYDNAPRDGVLSYPELQKVTSLSLNPIMNPQGLELLTYLETLTVTSNGTVLDLSNARSVRDLSVLSSSGLTSLNVGGLVNLDRLWIHACDALTSVDISANTALTRLSMDECAQLSGVDYSKNVNLTTLSIRNCPNQPVLDVSNLAALRDLCVSDTSLLTALDLTKNANLEELGIYNCPALTALDVTKNGRLQILGLSGTSVSALDVSNCPSLYKLNCSDNAVTSLDISNCPKLLECVAKGNKEVETGGTSKYLHYWMPVGDDYYNVNVDQSMNLITKKAGEVAAGTLPTIKVTTSTEMILVGKPRDTCQIDPEGQTGKGYKSSNIKVATVSNTGMITIKKAGRVKITFKVGKKKRTLKLTIKDTTVPDSVTLSQSGTVTLKKGETLTLTASLPDGTNSAIKWTSSNKKVATVKNGVVTCRKKGKATITAIAVRGKKKAKVKIRVTN